MSDDDKPTVPEAIVKTLLEDAFDLGYSVSHYDGEDYTFKKVRLIPGEGHSATDLANQCLIYLGDADIDTLVFSKDGRKVGSVMLIFENGWDVISDCTDDPEIDAILAGALELAEDLEKSILHRLLGG